MVNVQEEIEQVNYELSRIQKNKATEHHIGFLRARLSKLMNTDTSKKTGGTVFAVKKQGDATVALVGFPSAGKSTLLNALTKAQSKIASYEFTTLKPIPGMMDYQKTKIQIIDAPGIIEGAAKGKGMGRQIISAVRNADMILILLDPKKGSKEVITKELYNAGIRLDTKPPEVIIKRTVKGGLLIQSTVKQELNEETIKAILREFGYINAEVVLKEHLSMERLIDALVKNRVYIPSITAVNKMDILNKNEQNKIIKEHPEAVLLSAEKKTGLEELKKAMWQKLEIKRIYLKEQGKEPDYKEPLIMKGKTRIKDVASKIRNDCKTAKVWGKSAKHEGQNVGLNHELMDEDVITLL